MNTRHEHAWTPMGTHEHLSTHEHPWAMSTHKFTWIPLNVHGSVMCSNKKSAGNLHVEPHVSQFLSSYVWFFVMQVFGVNGCFEHYFFVYVLCTVVLSCVGFAPQEAIHCCKTWFLTHISHICVCVGVSQNEVSFFPRKATVLEPKKDTSCWDIPRWVCVCAYIYICM